MQAEWGSLAVFSLNAGDWDSTRGVPPKLHLQRADEESVRSPSVMKPKSHPELASPIQGGTSLKTGVWIKRISFIFSWVFWSPAMRTLIMSCAPSAFVLQEYCRAIMNPPPSAEHTPLPQHKLALAIAFDTFLTRSVNAGFISFKAID